jgi:hypothetical protein
VQQNRQGSELKMFEKMLPAARAMTCFRVVTDSNIG